jgi:hypothetical protein
MAVHSEVGPKHKRQGSQMPSALIFRLQAIPRLKRLEELTG